LANAWTAGDVPWGGDPLLFYTDGLIENPKLEGPPRRWDADGLLAWLDGHLPIMTAREFLDALLEAATDGRDLRDDIAILLVAADR
jgi:Stage II sporulation protein E (SpoIIE)